MPIAGYQVGRDNLTSSLRLLCNQRFEVSETLARYDCCVQNLEQLTFEDESFDLIICSDVLEHVRRYRQALAELARVTEPGGAVIITVPETGTDEHESFCEIRRAPERDVWQPDAPRHSDPLDPDGCLVYRHFGQQAFMNDLQAVGLTPTRTEPYRQRYGIVNCAVYIGRKT